VCNCAVGRSVQLLRGVISAGMRQRVRRKPRHGEDAEAHVGKIVVFCESLSEHGLVLGTVRAPVSVISSIRDNSFGTAVVKRDVIRACGRDAVCGGRSYSVDESGKQVVQRAFRRAIFVGISVHTGQRSAWITRWDAWRAARGDWLSTAASCDFISEKLWNEAMLLL